MSQRITETHNILNITHNTSHKLNKSHKTHNKLHKLTTHYKTHKTSHKLITEVTNLTTHYRNSPHITQTDNALHKTLNGSFRQKFNCSIPFDDGGKFSARSPLNSLHFITRKLYRPFKHNEQPFTGEVQFFAFL